MFSCIDSMSCHAPFGVVWNVPRNSVPGMFRLNTPGTEFRGTFPAALGILGKYFWMSDLSTKACFLTYCRHRRMPRWVLFPRRLAKESSMKVFSKIGSMMLHTA